MNEAPEIVRLYTSSDSYMTTTTRAIYTIMGDDLALFTAFDATINSTFYTAFNAAITAAENVVSDNVVIDQVATKTTAVEQALVTARNKYGEIRYFIMKAWPTDTTIQGEFGINDYENVRRSAPKMSGFLHDMHSVAVERATALGVAGCDGTRIASIATVRTSLATAIDEQTVAIRKRRKTTEDRINTLNACYEKLMAVNAAAQIVFMNDAAKLAQYVFDASGDGIDGPGTYDGFVEAGGALEAAHVIYGATRVLEFNNTGDTQLQFFLNGGGNFTPQGTVVTLTPGGSQSQTMADLDATGNHIIVKNMSDGAEGRYSVTVGDL